MVLTDIKSKGIIIRSKERDIEEGEKCTRYFFKKIMDKGEGIFKLKKTNGEQTKTLEEINKVIEDFYGELYEEKHIEKQSTTEILKNIEKKIDGSTFLTRDPFRTAQMPVWF